MARRWTDEMHASFLDRMEASFVERMLMGWREEGGSRRPCRDRLPSPSSGSSRVVSGLTELDPYMADSAESSLDCSGGSRNRRAAARRRRVTREFKEHRARKGFKTRKMSSCRSHNNESSIADQVVPIVEGQNTVASAKERTKVEMGSSSYSSLLFDADVERTNQNEEEQVNVPMRS